MNGTQLAMERLATWPDLHDMAPACGAGPALRTAEAEIVHFHGRSDAELHLTAAAIQRLRPELSRSTAIRLHLGSAWVTVHLDCEDDIALLTSLVSLALQAHTSGWPRPVEARSYSGERQAAGAAVMDAAHSESDGVVLESKAIEQVLERLKARYTGMEPTAVGAAVKEAEERLRDARIRDFVPIFVERQARRAGRLR
ncbi:three-helix bundle dimerization domain-containing protein [Streptomyces sp. NPDC002623]